MASLAKILRLDKLNKKGEAPVYFRIIKNRKVRYIASSVRLAPKYWNKNKEVVKGNHPNYKRLNSYLSNKYTELQDKLFEHETISKSLNTAMLKEHILGKAPADFIAFARKDLDKLWKAGKIGTHDKRKSIINKLIKYLDGQPLYFQNIDVSFLNQYEQYLRNHHGNGTNTVYRDLKHFRKLFNDAVREEVIEAGISPFLKYQLKTEKTQREYLTEKELSKIENLSLPEYSRLDLHRDMFVFAAYVGGLRVSDVLLLQYNFIDNNHLHTNIRKTGSQLSIKLPRKAMEIIQKWKTAPNASPKFIFPILPNDINLKDESTEAMKILDGILSSATAYMNKNLKIIAQKAEIKKNVSTHIARHTWATRALRKGISIDKVSKLMGHAQLRETQIYAKIVNEELDRAMDLFD